MEFNPKFEGAFRDVQIYINGKLTGTHRGGYTGFSLDISESLKTGSNVLAVRLNNNWNARLAPRNGDHNFTGGIYRDVCLTVTDAVHVTWYETSVTTPGLSKKAGTVNIQTEVRNDANISKTYTIKTDIVNPSGKVISSVSSQKMLVAGSAVIVDQTTSAISKPQLWHPEHPSLYKAVTSITDGKRVLDNYETTFGFRWMKWTADSGFYLNGERYYFRGANVHQDHAGWASAVTNSGFFRDVQMVKDCGMDFIRGSHLDGLGCRFKVHDKGNGRVSLEALNGTGFLTVVGMGLTANVRLLKDESESSVFQWQDMLHNQCMLLSLKTNRYVGPVPETRTPYAANFPGTRPDRKDGTVYRWEITGDD